MQKALVDMFSREEVLKIKVRALNAFATLVGSEKFYLVGKRRYYFFKMASPALKYDYEGRPWQNNAIENVGKDSILKRLGNLSGGGYAAAIGVGDSTDVFDANDTDLQAATNKLWKTIVSPDGYNYIRPTLFLMATFGFTEAVWTWNELAVRDNNSVIWARQVDSAPLAKPNDKAAIAEWQFTL